MYSTGTKVVYPTHGVGWIEAIEKKEVGDGLQPFYVVRIIGNGMTILVPTKNAQRVGLRAVIEPSEIPKVLAILQKNDLEISSNWNRRFKDNLERIRTGSVFEVALVLRKLVLLQQERSLSFGEKTMLENVRRLIVSEISHASGIDQERARALVEQATNHR
ncbi:CarD family transcriptional regulator [Candidatus Methylomirabilis lanthanidiphila]|uniref:CarD family transcriptional regulator n=1 Tax=Candidatus Methylomirabilis lanthanidiphila TaxID=2211376 RepID=A0A564ZJC4_9BACT|nr:CarD family transcriptional regulator [Candidatus Methylomirabilis lanthanidiphila]